MSVSFDRVADIYDETRSLPADVSDRITETILSLSKTTPHTHFFEPGIGTGRIALPLVLRGYRYTGVDISDEMMTKLRQKLGDTAHRLSLVNASATSLPFPNGTFDVAIAAHILHLISDWQTALAEIWRVLHPEGMFLYFHHPTGIAVPDRVDQQWQTLLADRGYSRPKLGADTADVLHYLTEQQAELETVTIARLQKQQTVGKTLQNYRDKIYSSFWQIPDEIFQFALSDLETWVAQTYASTDVLTSDYEITLTAVRSWAGNT